MITANVGISAKLDEILVIEYNLKYKNDNGCFVSFKCLKTTNGTDELDMITDIKNYLLDIVKDIEDKNYYVDDYISIENGFKEFKKEIEKEI